jgi:hypothetical protein
MSFETVVIATALALALMLGLGGAAAEQSPQPRADTPAAGDIVALPKDTILARDFLGQAVLGADSFKLGTVNDLVLSKDGRTVAGFIVAVGGFLGIGERNVVLRIDRLRITPAPDGSMKLVTDLKREDLINAPAFKPRRGSDGEKRAIERPMQPEPPADGPQK